MFILFVLFTVNCIAISVFVRCQFIKPKYYKYAVCVITALITVISSVFLVVDSISYLKGGTRSVDKITLSQTKITKKLDYFTVNDAYWSIGGNFQKYKMIIAEKAKHTEIKTVLLDSLLEQHELIIHYLPVSKFIIKMEVTMIDGDLEVSNYELLKSGYYMYENKLMSYVAVLSFVIMITVIILTIVKRRKRKYTLLER